MMDIKPLVAPASQSSASSERFTRSQPCRTGRSSHAMRSGRTAEPDQPAVATAGEVIETHFIHRNFLYFVVSNASVGEIKISQRQRLTPVQYAVKPLWYMAGTPALRQYYNSNKVNANDKTLIPVQATQAQNAGISTTMRGLSSVSFYRCTVEAYPGDPKTLTERSEYSLRIPSNWGQLAHCRLLHSNINRVVACACMPTSAVDNQTVNVYVVCWQDEQLLCELLPVTYLNEFTHHDHHHEVALDYWEEACVQDVRWFRSAATVDYAHQNTTLTTNQDDDFWVKCVHTFRGRSFWTDESGNRSNAMSNLFVQKWIGWPMTTCRVSNEELKSEIEEDELDPDGFDEFVLLAIYDKLFMPESRSVPDNDSSNMPNAEYMSYKRFMTTCNAESQTAHVPPAWCSMAEHHAEQNDTVNILAVFRHKSIANVYIVQWPSYKHITLVPSQTLRKRHSRIMLEFFERNAYLPKLQLLKPEKRPA